MLLLITGIVVGVTVTWLWLAIASHAPKQPDDRERRRFYRSLYESLTERPPPDSSAE